MPRIRKPAKIDRDASLIDIGDSGIWNSTGVYLIGGDRTCLIDAGTQVDAARIIQTLRETGAFPPDVILLTHSHYDHAQGVPVMRAEASKEGKSIEVLASREAVPLLREPSYRRCLAMDLTRVSRTSPRLTKETPSTSVARR
jgi:glyoxylase-like metal-dependent hydrolase (beta-lactamase superfamily II)